MTDPAGYVEPWEQFLGSTFKWRQGEHVAFCGPTGVGKSTLGLAFLPLREWVVVICTKPRDSTIDSLKREGYKVLRQWPPNPAMLEPGKSHRFVLWPKFQRTADQAAQAANIRNCLEQVFTDGAWTVFLDEQQYISEDLGCRDLVRLLYKQGRSLQVSLVAGNQRPRWVPRETWTEATHLLLFKTGDREDLKALSGLGVASSDAIKATVPHLPSHHVLYVNTRTGTLAITKAPPRKAGS